MMVVPEVETHMCNVPISSLLEGTYGLVVYYDASHQGLGDVLRNEVVGYAFTTTQNIRKQLHYPWPWARSCSFRFKDLETFTLEICTIYKDHKNLEHTFDQKELKATKMGQTTEWLQIPWAEKNEATTRSTRVEVRASLKRLLKWNYPRCMMVSIVIGIQ